STTLFNAAFRSGLEIVEFTRHSFPSSYIGKGLDTTVNLPTPVIDLKFRNNKSYPIYIRSFYANSKINFEMYGEPLSNDKVIKIRTDEYETVPAPEPNYVEDAEGEYVQYKDEEFEKVKSREGYKVRVYREIYQDDKLLESELFDDHFYRPIKGIIYTGIEERPETAKDNNPADTDIQLKIIETIP
ncbi:MAG: VanW family protein, partial [Firmicutes bacterium]|nr:VanW family protein [Bacillota bacterium]